MSKFAPKVDGLNPYLVTTRNFGNRWHRIEYATDLAAAKESYGWTRQMHTTKSVRRARVEDRQLTDEGWRDDA